MKNIVMISILAFSGSAFAAGNTFVLGSSSAEASFVQAGKGSPTFSVNVGVGAEQVIGAFDGRIEGGFDVYNGGFGLGFSADLLYPFGKSDLKPYVGFGLGIGIGSGHTTVALRGNLGADFEFTRAAAIFAELNPQFVFNQGNGFYLGGRAGLKVFL